MGDIKRDQETNPHGHTKQSFNISGCCNNPDTSIKTGSIYTPKGWKVRYLLTICENCGKIKARSNFYDAEERV